MPSNYLCLGGWTSARLHSHTPMYQNCIGTRENSLPGPMFDEIKRLPERQQGEGGIERGIHTAHRRQGAQHTREKGDNLRG